MKRGLPLLLLVGVTLASPQERGMSPAVPQSDKKVALVIGNGGYANAPLRNPAHDARSVTITLRSLGFEVVTHNDLDQKGMVRAIIQFGERLSSGGIGLFYYSGHGVQVRGNNYLIPVGAQIRRESDVEIEAVTLERCMSSESSGHLLCVIHRDSFNFLIAISAR